MSHVLSKNVVIVILESLNASAFFCVRRKHAFKEILRKEQTDCFLKGVFVFSQLSAKNNPHCILKGLVHLSASLKEGDVFERGYAPQF